MGKLATFLLGGLVGAGIMAVTATKTGEETRTHVLEAVNDVKSTAVKASEEGGPAAVASQLASMGKDAAAHVVANSQQSLPPIHTTPEMKELQHKIDEARDRIAARVASNAAGTVGTKVEGGPGVINPPIPEPHHDGKPAGKPHKPGEKPEDAKKPEKSHKPSEDSTDEKTLE